MSIKYQMTMRKSIICYQNLFGVMIDETVITSVVQYYIMQVEKIKIQISKSLILILGEIMPDQVNILNNNKLIMKDVFYKYITVYLSIFIAYILLAIHSEFSNLEKDL